MPNGRTDDIASDIERFEGTRTLLHQGRYRHEISLVGPRQGELPEVDTAWEG